MRSSLDHHNKLVYELQCPKYLTVDVRWSAGTVSTNDIGLVNQADGKCMIR